MKKERELSRTRRMLSALIDNVPDIAWIKDAEGRFVIVNEAYSRAVNMPIAEMIGKTDFDVWRRELAENYRADDSAVMAAGLRTRIEEPYVAADGRVHFVETIKTPLKDDNGEVVGTVGIARDVTERRQAEHKAWEAGEQLRAIIDNSPAMVFLKDVEGKYLLVNSRFADTAAPRL
jgi:PAS domain S-box-containing protein